MGDIELMDVYISLILVNANNPCASGKWSYNAQMLGEPNKTGV